MSVAVDLELTPGLDEVRELAREHNLVPLRHTFIADCETPVSAYLKLRGGGPSFLLESAEQGQRVGRWSFLGFRPRATHPHERWATTPTRTRQWPRSSAATGSRRSTACRRSPAARWACSATTWCAAPSRPSGAPNPDEAGHPRPGADDHRRAGGLRPPAPRGHRPGQRVRRTTTWRRSYEEAAATIAEVKERLAGPVPAVRGGQAASRPSSSRTSARTDTRAAVERAKEYIRAGDAYQVVPSQRWTANCPVEAFSIYRGLRAINPSPYMYFLDFEDFEIAGASPESLVKVDGTGASSCGRSPARGRAPAPTAS